jgi:trk system potassium uptake protein TrkH
VQLRIVIRIIGLLLMGYGFSMWPPIMVSLIYADGEMSYFVATWLMMLGLGLALFWPVRKLRFELRTRHGFLIVVLFWTVLGVFSGLPFFLSPSPVLSFTDSVFEAVSGFTTTGATVITGLDSLPPSVLYYRAQLQFLGGMGIIVLAVAIIPMLGVGGMALYRAETPGPMKEDKLTPRIAHTARALWMVYVGLNLACGLAYWLGGMTVFDALCHAFTTIATGGFSTHDASFGFFDSALLDWLAVLFMFLGGVNFALHFVAFRNRSLLKYLRDAETRAFVLMCAALIFLITALLLFEHEYDNPLTALRFAAFELISVVTTTGFTTANFVDWPSFLPILLIYVSFIGGCAGSTSGGMKVMRVMLLVKQAGREVGRLIHPHAVLPIKVGEKVMREEVISAVWGFFALYAASTAVLTLAVVATGQDILSAFSAVAACLNVLGPGLGSVATTMIGLTDAATWTMIFAMLLGRLEIFTLFVLLTPAFWRR